MTADETLDRLAKLHGIHPGYHDIWGHYHTLDPTAKRGLLASLGLPVDDPGALDAALHERLTREWRRALPPVQVVREDHQPATLQLTLPAASVHELAWMLTREDGSSVDGSVNPERLEHLTRRELDGIPHQRYAFRLPQTLPCGYHRLALAGAETSLIVVPARCYLPDGGRCWGLAVQLYALRSARNWGMGDFGDLARLVDIAAALGAACIGLNPLHALSPSDPERASPYSPTSRRWLNPLYLDIETLPDFADCPDIRERVAAADFRDELARLRATELVDYRGVAAAKFDILRRLFQHFRDHHLAKDSARARDFRDFQARAGEPLQRYALFETLQHWFRELDPDVHGWTEWLPGFRDPAGPTVQRFAETHEAGVEFHQYLQWLARQQLQAVAEQARRSGLDLGLYRDLAVGDDSAGAETWAHRAFYAVGTRVGAPPDDFSPGGQDWGLPPMIPERLRESAYAPFIDLLRANMRDAGVLRIDHVMALTRLFWVPPGTRPAQGAYVRYPLADLLGILALESQRHRCLVIGEDLGTVPDDLRGALHESGVFTYRVMYFEKHRDGHAERFKTPDEYPEQALVAATTHDLPPLAGFWSGCDIDWRERLGLFPDPGMAAEQRAARAAERERLLQALEQAGLKPADAGPDSPWTDALTRAVYTMLARTPTRLLMVQAEDAFGQVEPVNLPGTVDEHPNWQRKLGVALEDWPHHDGLRALAETLRRSRGTRG